MRQGNMWKAGGMLAVLVAVLVPELANVAEAAGTGGGGGQPAGGANNGFTQMGNALGQFADFVTGPYAATASLIGVVVAGSILIWGNDLNRFGQTVFYLILVIGLIVVAANIINGLFTTGASVGSGAWVGLGALAFVACAALLALLQRTLFGMIRRPCSAGFRRGRRSLSGARSAR